MNLRTAARRFGWIRYLVTIVLLFWVLKKIEWPALATAFNNLDWRWLAAAYGLSWGVHLLHACRWQQLVRIDHGRLPFKVFLRCLCIGHFWGQFFPKTVGLDLTRGVCLSGYGIPHSRSLAIVFADRLVGIGTLVVLAMVLGLLAAELMQALGLSVAALLTVSFLVLLAIGGIYWTLAHKSLETGLGRHWHQVGSVSRTLQHFLRLRQRLTPVVALAVGQQLTVLARYVCVAEAVGIGRGALDIALVSLLVVFLTSVPVTVNGIGLRENGSVYLLGLLQVGSEAALAFALLNYSLMLVMAATGGLFALTGQRPVPAPTGDHRPD